MPGMHGHLSLRTKSLDLSLKQCFTGCMSAYDERDTIFSRMELVAGSQHYNSYYAAHPERKAADDCARARRQVPQEPPREQLQALQQELLQEHPTDEVLRLSLVDSTFGLLENLRPLARATATSGTRLAIAPDEATSFLRNLAVSYGAVLFGTAQLGEACFYGTRGRGREYGQPVSVPGNFGAVFAVQMKAEEIATAPAPRAATEVVNGYTRVALIGLVLAHCIRGWGWDAACTMDGRADVVLPVAARYAGLGSLGRSGLLLTEEYGPCIRLGAVLTNLELGRTPRKASTAARLCSSCDRCAQACPAGAIDRDESSKGQFRPVDDDACFAKWQEFGTDCGVCLASCPLSRIELQASSSAR
jgi:ferredoxin